MNINALTILIMVLIQSLSIVTSSEPFKPATNLPSWYYFWEDTNLNPTLEKSSLEKVDCRLAPNIINWVPDSIVFDKNLNFDWAEAESGRAFSRKLNQLRNKCQRINVLMDPELRWNKGFVNKLTKENIPVVVNALIKFCSKYGVQGLVISFGYKVNINPRLLSEFFKKLKGGFSYYGLRLVGLFANKKQYKYITPIYFKYLDEILIQIVDYDTPNKLITNMPTAGDSSIEKVIRGFLLYGAPVNKISIQMAVMGNSFKRTSKKSSTNYDKKKGYPKAKKYGSFLFDDSLFTDKYKAYQTFNAHSREQICKIEASKKWKKRIDPIQKTPYAYNNKDWISYDDKESFKIKMKIIEKYKLKVYVDAINLDDFKGSCGQGKYPMTKTIINLLNYDFRNFKENDSNKNDKEKMKNKG